MSARMMPIGRRSAALVVAALLVLSALTIAAEGSPPSASHGGPLTLTFRVTPKTLPRDRFTRAALLILGDLARPATGDLPPPLALIETELDGGIALDQSHLPSCSRGQLEARGAARPNCGGAVIGTGKAQVAVAKGEEQLEASMDLSIVNGGLRGNEGTLFVRGAPTALTPAPVVATVKVRPALDGRGRSTLSMSIPPLAGGSGTLLRFSLSIGQGPKGPRTEHVVTARCTDRQFRAALRSYEFRDGQRYAGESLSSPCVPAARR